KITDLPQTMFNLMRLLGATPDDKQKNTIMALATSSPDFKTDQGGDIGKGNLDAMRKAGGTNRDTVKEDLINHVAGDQVVIVLGSPKKRVYNSSAHKFEIVEVGWKWGGDNPSEGGRPVAAEPGGGHFVVVRAYDPVTQQFTVLDPSWAMSQPVPLNQ